jgi:hypothetical protein
MKQPAAESPDMQGSKTIDRDAPKVRKRKIIVKRRPEEVTGLDTRKKLLTRVVRPAVPVRSTFVQAPPGTEDRTGPLKEFARIGDKRGLRAYLMVVASCSNINEDGWTTTLDSMVWARLFDAHVGVTPQSARTGAWRTLLRLQERKLLTCTRKRGSSNISVTLLREDGSGEPYVRPDGIAVEDRFFSIPNAFWTEGFAEKLDTPGLVMLLTVAHGKAWSSYPAKRVKDWYGWSEDTTERGLQQARDLGLVKRRETYEKKPLAPVPIVLIYQYRVAGPMVVSTRKKTEATT